MTKRRSLLALGTLFTIACTAASPDDSGDEANAPVAQEAPLAAAPTPVGGLIAFDSFAGSTTDAKIQAMNAWAQSLSASTSRAAVVFEAKVYQHTVPIELWSGLSLIGGRRVAAREFSTGTVLNYQGAAGTSQFAFVANTSQGYPSDGSPRDLTFQSIQFTGGPSVHHMPKYDPGGGAYKGHTLWYVNWRDCGWVGFATIWWGWGDGVTISGITHVQAVGDTPFFMGGSENHLFENYSFIDTGTPGWTSSGKPFLRSRMEKSSIGRMMFSARSNSYQISVEWGSNLVIDGAAFDAPDSAPTSGKQISISGGNGIHITNCSFKGAMANPAAATGGTAQNRALIHVTGGSQIVIDGNNFLPKAPLLWTGPNVGARQVKWGLNGYPNNTAPQLQQSKADQIVNIDPTVPVNLAP
jgi:hypothetical protein